MFWLKVATWAMLVAYQLLFGNGHLSFYRNLGLALNQLYGFAISADMLVWLLGSIIILLYET